MIFVWSVKDKAMAQSMDQDILLPKAGQTNRTSPVGFGSGALPLSFQPAMPRPPRIRSTRSNSSARSNDTYEGIGGSSKNRPTSIELACVDSALAVVDIEQAAEARATSSAKAEDDEADEVTLASTLIFHTEYYLTYLRSKEEYASANIDPAHQKYLKFGRPSVPALFEQTRELCEAEGIKRVAVFVCGPSALVNEVADHSRASKMGGMCGAVRFDCHAEVFDF